jgi:hypothetical protein
MCKMIFRITPVLALLALRGASPGAAVADLDTAKIQTSTTLLRHP